MCFVAPEQKLLYGQFFLPDSVERVLEPGVNFAKIFTPWSRLHWVLWLQSRSCFTAIFLIWLCQACVRTRGLISLKFSRPGLVYTVFCCSRAEVGLRQFLLPDSVELVLEPGAINFITPRSCLQFILGIVSPAEVISRRFLLPVSVERFI